MLTDVVGVLVGHATDAVARTGCTCIVVPDGAAASCEVRGLAPATRETDLLDPVATVAAPHAIVLAGGSAFGLAAADGVVRALEADGRGFPTPAGLVPIVSAACIYDLGAGRADVRPTAADGEAAYRAAAGGPHAVGRVGAGTGATVGKLDGEAGLSPGGLGAASLTVAGGAVVAALAVVNAFGDVLAADGTVLAGLVRDGRFPGTAAVLAREPLGEAGFGRQATTLVCVATDAALDPLGCGRLARAASAGVARATSPAATALDGDVAFAFATGAVTGSSAVALASAAAEVVAAAVRDAVTARP